MTRVNHLWFYKRLYSIRPASAGAFLKRVFGIQRRPVSFPDGTFFIDPCSHFGLTLLEEATYEADLRAVLQRHLRPGSVFADVGANEGFFTIVAAKLVGPTGRVISVEPQTRLGRVLTENARLNNVHNVRLLPVAISNVNGTVDLFLAPDTNTGSTGLMNTRKYRVPKETVKMVTLEELLDSAGTQVVDLMKMDVEGFEHEAILGSPQVFESKRVKLLALELHDWILRDRGLNPEEITGFLSKAGYTLETEGRMVIARA